MSIQIPGTCEYVALSKRGVADTIKFRNLGQGDCLDGSSVTTQVLRSERWRQESQSEKELESRSHELKNSDSLWELAKGKNFQRTTICQSLAFNPMRPGWTSLQNRQRVNLCFL
jgi:hypothetical protein